MKFRPYKEHIERFSCQSNDTFTSAKRNRGIESLKNSCSNVKNAPILNKLDRISVATDMYSTSDSGHDSVQHAVCGTYLSSSSSLETVYKFDAIEQNNKQNTSSKSNLQHRGSMVKTRGTTARKTSGSKVTKKEPEPKETRISHRGSSTPNAKTPTKVTTPKKKATLPTQTSMITEEDIIACTNSNELVRLVNTLTHNRQDEIFDDYKQKTSLQLKKDSQLIQSLSQELDEKQATIDLLTKQLAESRTTYSSSSFVSENQNTFHSPIRKKMSRNNADLIGQEQLSKELENIGITLDMLELLTGLRIANYMEDNSKFHFDIQQNSTNNTNIYIEYRLVISKTFESTAEINYIPTFLEIDDTGDDEEMQERLDNRALLKKFLPEYLCDNLSFPYNTLSQFYNKMNRALNKVKSQ